MTTTVLATIAKQRFFDAVGVPLAGGKLFTYAAGTVNKQNSYTDSTGNTPNANPIILDSQGYCNLWFDTTLLYKLTLAPATDTDPPSNPIWTVDNLNAPNSSVYATLITLLTSVGSALIGFIQAGTGAVLRLVQDKLRERVSVFDFIPVAYQPAIYAGTSTVDVYTYIQAAIDALPVTSYNLNGLMTGQLLIGSTPILDFGSGKFKITKKLNFGPFHHFEGRGAIINQTDATEHIFYSTSIYTNKFKGITFVGGKSHIYAQNGATGVAGTEGALLRVEGCDHEVSADFAIQTRASGAGGGFQALIKRGRFMNCKQSLYTDNDWTELDDSWIGCYPQGGLTHPWANDTAQIVNHSQLNLNNLVLIPGDPDFALVGNTSRWIDNYNSVIATKTRFGGEYSGLPLVYNFTDALSVVSAGGTDYPYLKGGQVIIRDSVTPCGSAARTDPGYVVLKSGLPNVIIIEGNQYSSSPAAFVRTNLMTAGTFAAYWATIAADPSVRPLIRIMIKNNGGFGMVVTQTDSDTALLQPYTEYDHLTTSNNGGNTNYLPQVNAYSLTTKRLLPNVYGQTSSSGAGPYTSIFDFAVADVPLDNGAIYLAVISGCSQYAGDSQYRNSILGIISIVTGSNGADTTMYVYWDSLVGHAVPAIGALTVTAAFWNGATEAATIKAADAGTNKIRLNVAGYQGASAVAAIKNQTVRVTKLL